MNIFNAICRAMCLIAFLMLLTNCESKKSKYGFNFEDQWTWENLKKESNKAETLASIKKIEKTITIDDANFLCYQISNLENPESIKHLSDLQIIQDSLGGSFYGLAPPFPVNRDTIPIPNSFDNLIATVLFLTEIRKANYDAILQSEYPVDFKGSDFFEIERTNGHNNLDLVLDYTCIRSLINIFQKENISFKDALEISSLTGFENMLRHRRNLGYIPEPLPTAENLAHFIVYAHSDDPIHMIWKWLTPWNFFNLSEIYMMQEEYLKLLGEIEDHEKEIIGTISDKMIKYVPTDFEFSDTLTIAVNWGIRSWATSSQIGTNIVQFKDDYLLLSRTLSHEAFHRVQLQLCPLNPQVESEKAREFEDLVSFPFQEANDRKFYETLSYIFLEGSASYIGGMDSLKINIDIIDSGIKLLDEVYNSIYIENDLDKTDELINRGLISNGPFYVLGYYIMEEITRNSTADSLRNILNRGSLGFFNEFIEISSRPDFLIPNVISLNKNIENQIISLHKIFVELNH